MFWWFVCVWVHSHPHPTAHWFTPHHHVPPHHHQPSPITLSLAFGGKPKFYRSNYRVSETNSWHAFIVGSKEAAWQKNVRFCILPPWTKQEGNFPLLRWETYKGRGVNLNSAFLFKRNFWWIFERRKVILTFFTWNKECWQNVGSRDGWTVLWQLAVAFPSFREGRCRYYVSFFLPPRLPCAVLSKW